MIVKYEHEWQIALMKVQNQMRALRNRQNLNIYSKQWVDLSKKENRNLAEANYESCE